ncbi:serine/threonine protein kinase [Microbacterium mangrovi]|uniref:non-specific serine/threonine protein kinase n=1 Tax=Microbacterium mangrovi TaxID=1348253 RepID=A0A0B2A584_9MICO|nr:Stk1 family PASTA domain-containing Ser/Thr kinase [Microbacterium mangrovi]KHK96934.1 serine/threonine protein kinase [Microbacterium mangrovi]
MSTSQQTDPLIGRLVDGRYRVRARIARGGMATVYVATDLRLERRVALKVMHSHLSDDAVFQSRFIQEARAAARLADPHVVNVFDQGQDLDMAYLVMEYLPGITLRELLRQQRRLSVSQAVSIMDAVLSGLGAAHRAGIVHRDVKPENVLLAEDGRIKIGDFGLARATTANTATGQMLLGTIAYLAPELVTRGMADARSDIYALGIMLYEMLTGEQPYKGEQPMQIAYQHATDSVPRPSVKNPGVPEQLDELVLWATERDPDDRPADADEMLARLREIERQLDITPKVQTTQAAGTASTEQYDSDEITKMLPPAPTGPITQIEDVDNAARLRRSTRRRASRGGWLMAVVLVLAVLAAALGWYYGSGPGSYLPVPDLTGKTYSQAQAALAEQQLVATRQERFDYSVAKGLVISSNPGAGTPLDKGTKVAVLVSLGPQPHKIGSLAGDSEGDARNALTSARVEVASTDRKLFSSSAPANSVMVVSIKPRGGGTAFDCTNGCTVHEGDAATLTVSVGAVPSVAGLSVDAATQKLTGVGLKVSGDTVKQSSSSVPKGDVIGMGDRPGGGNWRPGDTVTLIVSTGPPLFAVPSVVGMTRDDAKQKLTDNGFQVSYNPLWDAVVNGLTKVDGETPDGSAICNSDGTMCAKGSTIDLTITGSF